LRLRKRFTCQAITKVASRKCCSRLAVSLQSTGFNWLLMIWSAVRVFHARYHF
jgi:hypothetical protein